MTDIKRVLLSNDTVCIRCKKPISAGQNAIKNRKINSKNATGKKTVYYHNVECSH